ncbi:hypothetical protein LIER_09080 [Lithospermum erythrorhizon]|uniref:Uncharacterized protein n=1 Tax=Lithospermum erythrorhizon TaxID=34254 RepID=A0AAV3PGD2_LITER
MEDEPVFSPMPIRSIPSVAVVSDPTMEVTLEIYNNYLPWVDYKNVRELDNPRARFDVEDDDVGGEKSHDEINIEEDAIEEEGKTTELSIGSVEPVKADVGSGATASGAAEPVTAKATDDGVTPSVTDMDAETAGNLERPSIGQDGTDTFDDDIQEVILEDAGQKKKSKKRKHNKSDDVGKSHVPKKKLSKEEKAAKKAKRDERRARRAAQEAGHVEAVEEDMPEEVRPSVVQPDVDDEWLPEDEPQGDKADEEAQEYEKEDVATVMEKRKKANGKLRINENRTSVGNRRIPKNVVVVSTTNVSLNPEEEQARWRFMANRRIAVEKML